MTIDHIFIFSETQGSEADTIASWGLDEGSSRVHSGQGTSNRKFYFEDFFLELLWVHDAQEAQQMPAAELGLWPRSQFRRTGRSRFGLCLVNTPDTDPVFADAHQHQPAYFPPGMSIDFIDDPARPWLPMLFRLPFRGPKKPSPEPRNHAIRWKKLRQAQFGVPEKALTDPLVAALRQAPQLEFVTESKPTLCLTFTESSSSKKELPTLDLVVK